MDNREQLEAIAKACGYVIQPLNGKFILANDPPKFLPHNVVYWNPYESDADCFRAMVDGHIEIEYDGEDVGAFLAYDRTQYVTVPHGNDKAAATRKAICDCLAMAGGVL